MLLLLRGPHEPMNRRDFGIKLRPWTLIRPLADPPKKRLKKGPSLLPLLPTALQPRALSLLGFAKSQDNLAGCPAVLLKQSENF